MNQMVNPPPHLLAEPAEVASRRAAPQPAAWEPAEGEVDLIGYWRAIMLRKWSILALAVLMAAIAAFVVSQMRPVYRSTATVLIEVTKPKVTSVEEVYSGVSANREYIQTQGEVIKSREVALRVVSRLNLGEHPEFDPRQHQAPAWRQWLETHIPSVTALVYPSAEAMTDADIEASVLRAFSSRLTVEPVRQSQLMRVRFESHSPTLAAAIANAVAQAYIQADIDNRASITAGASTWINDRLRDLKAKLDSSEKALQTYREREGLLDSKTTVLGGTGRQLDEFTQRLVDARVRRAMAEEAFNEIKAGEATNYQSVPAVVRAPSVQQAQAIQNDAEKKLAEVSERYGPDHPRHVAARSELAAARASTRREIQVIIDSVQRDLNAARATEKTIEAALEKSKGAIQQLNRKEIQLAQLEREAATNRQLYETFLVRHRETSATSGSQQPNARLVDPAVPAAVPVRPAKAQTIGIAGVMGLCLGLVGALTLSRLDNTVKTSGDVENKLRQPFLAALPVLTRKESIDAARAAVHDPHGVFSESIRTAATGIMLSALDTSQKIVVVTSSVPGEGKSTVAMNLAFSLSAGKRVVLIEGDMRRPTFAKSIGVPPSHAGLSELISGAALYEECMVQVEGTQAQVIPSGRVPPNPLELLGSQRFRDLLAELRDKCDLIIIDSPPVQIVSDALLIGRQSTGLVYVVKADDTPGPLAKAGLKRIAAAGIPIFGVVLNQQDFKKADRYYGEYSGYGKYGYGRYYGRAEKQA